MFLISVTPHEHGFIIQGFPLEFYTISLDYISSSYDSFSYATRSLNVFIAEQLTNEQSLILAGRLISLLLDRKYQIFVKLNKI